MGYCIFLWASLALIDPGNVTPDLLVAAIVFLIGACLVNLCGRESYGKFALFGLLCGAAYLARAIMFPLGFCFLGILLFCGKRSLRRVWGVLLAGALFLGLCLPFIDALSKQKGRFTFIAAACVWLGAYALVLVRPRYVGASFVMLTMAILAGVRLPKREASMVSRYVTTAVMVTMVFSVATHLAETAYAALTAGHSPVQKEQMEAADGLRGMGLRAGDAVAVIGDGETEFWARLGRFKIVSEVSSPDSGNREFWATSWEQRRSVYECLRQTGANIVVVWNPPENGRDPGWSRISNTKYYAQGLRK